MNNLKIVGPAMPDMPWEDRPAGSKEVMWRYSANPIIRRRRAFDVEFSIFNSAVIPFKKGKYNYAGVFRCDDTNRRMRIHAGFLGGRHSSGRSARSPTSDSWARIAEIGRVGLRLRPACCEDRRILRHVVQRLPRPDDRHRVDRRLRDVPPAGERISFPINRNGVLFPRKINGRFAMLSRPSDNGSHGFRRHLLFGESPDMEFWGRHRHVMSPAAFEVSAWQCMKIGAGPVPIETSEGWLLLYHGVLRSCNGYVYAFGSALLDLDQPWKTIARSGPYLISPREIYELTGDVPNVTFPCASLARPRNGPDRRLLRMRRHRHGPCVRLYP
ncbi:MAG: glycosidase [Alistipes shahii]|uniref:glycoside hydrolase family 130 protein n=1 Tax=Alistipes shahii TaxID=328814 RepID=UPI003990A3A1